MRSTTKRLCLLGIGCMFLFGCGTKEPPPSAPPPAPAAKPAPPPVQQPETPPLLPPIPAPEAKAPATPPPAAPDKPELPPGHVLEKAEQGVGEKGHYDPGLITTPVATFFAARERIAFEIQVPKALEMFKALENRPPKDEKEFMDKVIAANKIALPSLPEGHRYFYDAKKQQLFVVRPGAPKQDK